MQMQIGPKHLKQIRMDAMKEKKKCKCDMNETKEKVVKSGIKVK